MCAVGVFDALVDALPKGWIAKLEKSNNIIEIFGPKDSMIIIKGIHQKRSSVIGKWPKDSSGENMDPYEWGVLTFNDNYPFTRLELLQTTKSKITNILNYIDDYVPIYNECLNRYHSETVAI